MIMKSPTAAGTRSPLAAVAAFGKGSANRSPAAQAVLIGAHPSDWHDIMRGRRSSASQPISASSAKAFHMPMRPVPPPVG